MKEPHFSANRCISHRTHVWCIYVRTFTMKINHSCRWICKFHGSYGYGWGIQEWCASVATIIRQGVSRGFESSRGVSWLVHSLRSQVVQMLLHSSSLSLKAANKHHHHHSSSFFIIITTITLPPVIMVQWKMGVSPILVSFHLGAQFSTEPWLWEKGYHHSSQQSSGCWLQICFIFT